MITRIGAMPNIKSNTNFKANLTEDAKKLLLKNTDKVSSVKVQEFLADEATKHLTVHALPFQRGYIMAVRSEKYPLAKDHLLNGDKALEGFVIDKQSRIEEYYPESRPVTYKTKFLNYSAGPGVLELDTKDPDITWGGVAIQGRSILYPGFKEGEDVSYIRVERNVPKVFSSNDFMNNILNLEKVKNFETKVLTPNHDKNVKKMAESVQIKESLEGFFSGLNYRSDIEHFAGVDCLRKVVNESAEKGELTEQHRSKLYSFRDGVRSNSAKIKFVNIEASENEGAKMQVFVASERFPKAGYQKMKEVEIPKERAMDAILEGLEAKNISDFVNKDLKAANNLAQLQDSFAVSRKNK